MSCSPPPNSRSLRHALGVDALITRDEYRAACAADQAHALITPRGEHALVRRSGAGMAHTRWYCLTPRDALRGAWGHPLGPLTGQECERALVWCAIQRASDPASIQVRAEVARRISRDVRYIMDENAPKCARKARDWSGTLLAVVLGFLLLGVVALGVVL